MISSSRPSNLLSEETNKAPKAVPLNSENFSNISQKRYSTGINELDRVFGGGIIPDSLSLLGGDPGIGKSTLLLQMARGLQVQYPELKILYVSGEESVEQIRGRAFRLNALDGNNIFISSETELERVSELVKSIKPQVLIMDSLQTFSCPSSNSAPGSASQVREVTATLMTWAKRESLAICLVGHITKDGQIAGPKMVEHMVDTVLYFEGDNSQNFRLLRAVKNRFGSSRELGVFEMSETGLQEVKNPSVLFLTERKEETIGTAVTASIEGSRPILLELQALAVSSVLAMPRRTSVGMDSTRLSMLAAICERNLNLTLSNKDLFFNVAGGLKLSEPACDLAAIAAIWSSAKEKPLPYDWVFLGELGLTGEVRSVSQLDTRLEEAHKLGFKTVLFPARGITKAIKQFETKIRLIPIGHVNELNVKLLRTKGS